jgi:hypothetical protein
VRLREHYSYKNKKRSRPSSSVRDDEGGLIEQVRRAVEAALKDVQKRLPADLVRQMEKTVGGGQKAVQSGLKAIQAQLKATARQAAALG